MSVPLANRLLSSANIMDIVLLQTLTESFIYIRNNRGPRIDPCGTQKLITFNFGFIFRSHKLVPVSQITFKQE